MAEGAFLWRRQLPGIEAHHAYAQPAYGLRECALPQSGRMLGPSHRYIHDPWRYLHARVRLLCRAFGAAARTARRGGARPRGAGRGTDEPAICRGDLGQSRR